jgi:hypothetical protein
LRPGHQLGHHGDVSGRSFTLVQLASGLEQLHE